MSNRSLWAALPLLLLLLAPPLRAQAPVTGPELVVNGVQLTVGGRLQTQFNTTSIDSEPPSELFIRRARIEIGVKVNDLVSGAIQPDFGGGEVDLKDAFIRLDFAPAVQLLVGKAYRPFGLIEQTSSKRMLPIERGLSIRGLEAADEYALVSGLGYTNRDIGLQLIGTPEGAPLGLAYAVGILRGPLHGKVGSQESYQMAGRVTARPIEAIRIGAGFSNRDFSRLTGGEPDLRRGTAVEVDLEYGAFAPGFHLLAELSRGDLDPFIDATFWGAHALAAYRTGPLSSDVFAIEPVIRVSHSDTDPGGSAGVIPGGTLVTPGINVYFGALNRFMLNYDVWGGGDGSADARSLKAMFQLGF